MGGIAAACLRTDRAHRSGDLRAGVLGPLLWQGHVDLGRLPQRQNLKRVRPPGSTPSTTVAERGPTRYTFHGGGPCDGALNGAVIPVPPSSGSAGQPSSAHALGTRATTPGSVTRAASPSITTSASRIDTAIEQLGWRSTLRPLRVCAPVWNQNVPSNQIAPTAVTCGVPSSLTVASHLVRELCASASGADPASSFSITASQSTGGSPSAAPRLMVSMMLLLVRPMTPVHSVSWLRRAPFGKVIACFRGTTAARPHEGMALLVNSTPGATLKAQSRAMGHVGLGCVGARSARGGRGGWGESPSPGRTDRIAGRPRTRRACSEPTCGVPPQPAFGGTPVVWARLRQGGVARVSGPDRSLFVSRSCSERVEARSGGCP